MGIRGAAGDQEEIGGGGDPAQVEQGDVLRLAVEECLGRARSSIGDLPDVPLLGALRPTSVDELAVCLKATKCDARSPDAGLNVSKCVDSLLTSGSEP